MPDQERYEADARGWLESLPVPPPRLDLDQIVATGRGQVRRRRYLTASGVTATVLAVAVAVPVTTQAWRSGGGTGADRLPGGPPAVECTVSELSPPDDLAEHGLAPSEISVMTVDPTGRYVIAGSEQAADGETVMIRWDGDRPAYLPAGRGDTYPVDVNGDGVVIGNSLDGDHSYGWVYDGQLVELPVPEGYQSASVAGINRAGDVVGSADDTEGLVAAVVWPAADREQPRILAAPRGRGIAGSAITDAGTVIGAFVDESGGGYQWAANGVGTELPLPDGASGGWVTDATGDWVVGEAALSMPADQVEPMPTPSGPPDPASPSPAPSDQPITVMVPVRWDLTTGTVAPVPGFEPGGVLRVHTLGETATAVSAAGDTVVTAYLSASVVRDGRLYALPTPMDGGTAYPVGISADGTVVVGSALVEGQPEGTVTERVPVVWHC